MNTRSMSIFIATIALQLTAASQVPDDLHDGIWMGSFSCSEGLQKGGAPFRKQITFIVHKNKGSSRMEGTQNVDQFTLAIEENSKVTIDLYGSKKANTNNAWVLHAQGQVSGARINTQGQLKTADGKIVIRDVCTISLENREVERRLASAKTERGEGPKAAKAEQQALADGAAQRKLSRKTNDASSPGATVREAVSTPPPKPVPATAGYPARTAAIANVDVSKAGPLPPTKVTTNPIDKIKKTGPNDVWINFNPSITVQERQFCRLVENYRAEYAAAQASNNQIKVNESLKAFTQALNSLLPDGKFQGWVMRAVSIAQASDGSADVLFELPCKVYVGSNTCDSNPKNFYGTVAEGSRVYTELAKMTVNDFALTGGRFVYAEEKVFDKTRSVASYGYMKTGAHCKSKAMPNNSEFFGVGLETLSTIK